MRKNVRYLVQASLIGAMYAALTFLQNLLFPESTSWAIQFRASEALCVLAFFTPAAIPGLSIGCFLFNLLYSGALPLDPIVGPIATALAAASMYATRKWQLFGLPLLQMLLPAVFNAILVGWELELYMGGGFWLNALYVCIGETAVLLTLGVILYYAIRRRNLRFLMKE